MKKYDNKQYYSLPQWVRKLCQDVYGVDPNDPTFIKDYALNEPLQAVSSQALSYFASNNVIGNEIRILKNWIVINGDKSVKVDDFIVDPSGKLYKVNAIDNEYYYINFVANLKGDKGDVGETIKIYGDLYDENNPLPSFEDALIGAYLFLDEEGKYDLYVKNTDATAWVVIDDWGGVPGPQGLKGDKGDKGDGVLKHFDISSGSRYSTSTNDLFNLNNFDKHRGTKKVMIVFVGFRSASLTQPYTLFSFNGGTDISINTDRNLTIIRDGSGPYRFVVRYFTLEDEINIINITVEQESVNLSFIGGEYRVIVL